MNVLKLIFKNLGTRIWFIVTVLLVIVFTVVTILSTAVFYELFNTVMPGGGERPIFDNSVDPIYVSQYESKKEAYEAANEVNIELCEEGMTLLKNEGDASLPLKTPVSDPQISAKPRISVFGKNSVNLAYGGSGSGGVNAADAIDLYKSLDDAGYEVNSTLKDFYEDTRASGKVRESNSSDLDSGESIGIATAETPQSSYTDAVKNSYSSDYKEAALVVFTRVGGEGFDLPRRMGNTEGASSADDHYLQLDKNELELLTMVCTAGFDRVIVIINSGAAMELTFLENTDYYEHADKIDSAIWMGFPGVSGTAALGRILNGSVNPSGKTVDTYTADHKADPTFVNFGDNSVPDGDRYFLEINGEAVAQSYYFVDYEESIYVGYKYYETRGYTDGQAWYDESVVYSFGHGLSYTDFEWSMAGTPSIQNAAIAGNEKYTVTINVRNTGNVAGKEVVQLYGNPPYNSVSAPIEKSYVSLVGFAKTGMIEPGETRPVEITFDPYSLASYDYSDANNNEFRGYELEGGNYNLFVSRTAHDHVFTIPFSVAAEGIRYEADPDTDYDVVNLYTDQEDEYFNSDMHLQQLLTRSNWTGEDSWPITPSDEDRLIDTTMYSALGDVTHNNPEDLDSEEMPWFDEIDEENVLTLRDMALYNEDGSERGEGLPYVDYEDERWQRLLEQCSASDLIYMYNYGAFNSAALMTIRKPRTNDTDGPVGFVNFMDSTTFYGTCSYCCEVVIASTWNLELVVKFGESVGEEGIWGDADGKSNEMPYSGWYAPGVNIHRSPFGGRNFEYFSEDGFLSGKMAAAQIKGCQSKGVYCFIKHFALNEQETHRSIGGNASWVTEQAMREIYLKPFEIAVKEGKTRAIMTSFNRIGTRWTGGDYRLCTEILRNEWGFRGTVICDFNTGAAYMNTRQMAYAGGDLNLSTTPRSWCDESDTADSVILMRCAKNIVYTVVNSNAMNKEVIGYRIPNWTIFLIVVDCFIAVGLAVWGFFAIRSSLKKQKTNSDN